MRKNFKKRAGFSLIEIVVVIAIMAIIAALLVPALIHYTEDSRAQKDVTTMDEVVNAVQLALADSDCFDEMELYSCDNNFITYTDSSGKYGQQVIDAEYWAPDGCGRATTITFNPEKGPNGETIYRLENAVINDMTYGNGSIAISRPMEGAQVEDNQCLFPNAKLTNSLESGYMYNKLKATIGTSVITTSATYANSSFTIFIKFSQKDGVTVADLNGAFNGTNLTEGASASVGSGTNTEIINPDTGNKEQGPATEDGGTQKNQYTSSALQGSGTISGGGTYCPIEDYKQPTYIDNLQKEHKFEYYSTLYAAVEDVNNNDIGKNADRDKHNAVAGIYQNDGVISVVLLKDTIEAQTANPKVDMTINLGGHQLKSNASGINQTTGHLTVDARILGSKIHVETNPAATSNSACIIAEGTCTVFGGEYYLDGTNANIGLGGIVARKNGCLNVYDANIEMYGKEYLICGIQVLNGGKGIIDNCTVKVVRDDSIFDASTNCIGLNLKGEVTVTDSKIFSYANAFNGEDRWTGGIAIGVIFTTTTGNPKITIKNCEILGTTEAIAWQSPNGHLLIDNCNLTGSYQTLSIINSNTAQSSLCIRNTQINQLHQIDNYTNDQLTNTRNALHIFLDTKDLLPIVHNCIIRAEDEAISSFSNLKMSSSSIQSGQIYLWNWATLYSGLRNQLTTIQGTGKVVETNEMYQ